MTDTDPQVRAATTRRTLGFLFLGIAAFILAVELFEMTRGGRTRWTDFTSPVLFGLIGVSNLVDASRKDLMRALIGVAMLVAIVSLLARLGTFD